MLLLGALKMNSVLLYVSIMLLWTVLLLIKNRHLILVSLVSGIIVLPINALWYAVISAPISDRHPRHLADREIERHISSGFAH